VTEQARWPAPAPFRDLRGVDAPVIAAAYRDEAIRHWLPVPRDAALEAYAAWADEAAALREDGSGLRLAVDRSGALASCLEVKRVDRRAWNCEISYWTTPAARRSGGTAASLRLLADWLVRPAGFRRVELRIAPTNTASLTVASRAGFTKEGTLRRAGFLGDGTVTDLAVWSRTDHDVLSSDATG
jgi:[ribosomal protein S5]-alanine N-acetyltransferase